MMKYSSIRNILSLLLWLWLQRAVRYILKNTPHIVIMYCLLHHVIFTHLLNSLVLLSLLISLLDKLKLFLFNFNFIGNYCQWHRDRLNQCLDRVDQEAAETVSM